jgi:periplasmic divalent cation tolerance protein
VPDCIVIGSAAPDRVTAERISAALVEEGLAAAVHVREVASRYRWKGEVVAAGEHVLDIYTSADRYDAVAARITALHPYEMPPIHVVPILDGPPGYLAWIASAGAVP